MRGPTLAGTLSRSVLIAGTTSIVLAACNAIVGIQDVPPAPDASVLEGSGGSSGGSGTSGGSGAGSGSGAASSGSSGSSNGGDSGASGASGSTSGSGSGAGGSSGSASSSGGNSASSSTGSSGSGSGSGSGSSSSASSGGRGEAGTPDDGSSPDASTVNLVQSAHASTSAAGTSLSVTLTQANVAGDLIAFAVGWTDTNSNVTTVADTAGNTYLKAVGPTIYSPDLSQVIYYAAGIKAAAANNKITVTMNTSSNSLDLRAAEFGGLSASAPLDVTAGSSGKATAATSGATTTTYPYELLFGAGMTTDLYSSAGAGFTLLAVTPNGNIFEYEIVQAAGSYSATATQPASTDEYVMQLATFR